MTPPTIALLVPAYNAPPWREEFLARMSRAVREIQLSESAAVSLVFVDDGSRLPGTGEESHRPGLSRLGCQVVTSRHTINRGQGAALQTALEIARRNPIGADYFVTFDADEQHAPEDVAPIISFLRKNSLNIVFGNRFNPEYLRESGIPRSRLALLRLASRFDRSITGLRLRDAHNGLRAFDARTASLIHLRQDRMAHATEFKQIVARHGLRYGEFPVRIRYTADSVRRGQDNLNAVHILAELAASWWFQ